MIAFGPIPTRRLGYSLGINNIPPKYCSYSCVYCQVGKAVRMDIQRKEFYSPQEIADQVTEKVRLAKRNNGRIDYLSFVPDGEPTLDLNLGATIQKLKSLDIPVAVITNGSLLWREDVQQELMDVNWISVKVDAHTIPVWKRVNHPVKTLDYPVMLSGIGAFRKQFRGKFTTETMLVKGLNDSENEINAIARFIAGVGPDTAYLAIPTRPPAVKSVRPPDEKQLTKAYQIFSTRINHVELLTGYASAGFGTTGNTAEDILSIASVHPIREDGMQAILDKAGHGWSLVEELVKNRNLVETRYRGQRFFVRKII